MQSRKTINPELDEWVRITMHEIVTDSPLDNLSSLAGDYQTGKAHELDARQLRLLGRALIQVMNKI